MDLSVIIACYNAADTLGAQLEALAAQQWERPWEVLVVNNRSRDDSVAVAASYQDRIPNLRVIPALERQGQPYALNVGVRAAAAPRIAFCDADDVVCAGWVRAMGEGLDAHPLISGPFELERLNSPAVLTSRGNPQPTGIQQYTYPQFLPHAGSGNLGVRRDVFEAVGGFDESMPYLFDTDFCWRAQLAGNTLTPIPEAVLHMRLRDTLKGVFRQARNYGEYNVLLYKRYRPQGMPALTLQRGLLEWRRLFKRVRHLRDPERRPRWIRQLGWRYGRLVGSLKYRVVAL